MASFEIAFKITGGHEGGYANNPLDRGGETYCGIARKFFPKWGGWPIIDSNKKFRNFPNVLAGDDNLTALVRAFYKENFWNALRLDDVANQPIANELYDTGVNMGTGAAALFLQRVLNVTNRSERDYADLQLDGRIGPATIKILNAHTRPTQVLKLLNCLQGTRYIDICERNPSQEVFMNSWASRVNL